MISKLKFFEFMLILRIEETEKVKSLEKLGAKYRAKTQLMITVIVGKDLGENEGDLTLEEVIFRQCDYLGTL